jgi:hypothetical protein
MEKLTPVVYLRSSSAEDDEVEACKAVFPTYSSRVEIPAGSLVFCRYSALPFNGELCRDLELLGSVGINSSFAHDYAATFQYYEDFKDDTFASWDRLSDVPQALREGAFVLKGRTNSRKQEWATKMFAPNFRKAVEIAGELMSDGLIGAQGVIARQYVALETFETAISGLPFANEWRCFYLAGERVAHGYYWGGIDDWAPVSRAEEDFLLNGLPFADRLGKAACERIPFCCIDVAKTQDGRWMMVEVNDGDMSGLNGTIDPHALYQGIARVLAAKPELLAAARPKPKRSP